MNKTSITTYLFARSNEDFCPDGTILARELRGENIAKKLSEIFGE